MTGKSIKEKLEQYNAAKLEMELIEEELTRYHQVHDSVRGSMPEHPYTLHCIPIAGIDITVEGMMAARRDKLAAQRRDVEEFLAEVSDPHIAGLLRLRYVKGLSWQGVAQQTGGDNTESGVKSAVYRYLEKTKRCNECNDSAW